jgi:hypothetical protein
MEVVLTIPDSVASEIQNGSSVSLSRRLLEFATIQAHEAELITERDVMDMLGFECREELYDFFKANDVRQKYAPEDWERERATADIFDTTTVEASSPTSLEQFLADMESLSEDTEHIPATPISYNREDIYFDHD